MNRHRITNAILVAINVAFFAGLLSLSYLLDGVTAAPVQANTATTAQQRFERAAQDVCGGQNASWELLDDGSVQCSTKRGHKTVTARVSP